MTNSIVVIQDQEFSPKSKLPRFWYKQHLRYCTLNSLEIYASIESNFFGTSFEETLFYMTLWNGSTLVECQFHKCKFQGSTFANCNAVHTKFSNCQFTLDNMGGQCRFTNSIFAQCEFVNCTFVLKTDKAEKMFEQTKFYDCKITNCTGFDYFQ
jgi:uncharacterized protein YjbI with pentapeptide repeats